MEIIAYALLCQQHYKHCLISVLLILKCPFHYTKFPLYNLLSDSLVYLTGQLLWTPRVRFLPRPQIDWLHP